MTPVKLVMVGTGYVGLVTGACFAELGHEVVCVDQDQRKIDLLNSGQIPIYEPGLEDLVARNVASGRLRFTPDLPSAVKSCDAVFICVGTPTEPLSGHVDLTQVSAVAEQVGVSLTQDCVVITKSTVPVGTNRQVKMMIDRVKPADVHVSVASNPEFLREGAAIGDFMEPDRVVVGALDEHAAEMMRRIYAPLISRDVPYVETGIETAELTKYAANAFLVTKLSFINEIADLCERVGADIDDVALGIGLDKRIGSAFLKTGPGWGGSCFPKDTRALQIEGRTADVPLRVVDAAFEANAQRKHAMAERILRLCGGELADKKIAVLGLTFKGQTDDMRDSPSIDILPLLKSYGAEVHGFDPSHTKHASSALPGITITNTPDEAVKNANALIIMTEWLEFKTYDYAHFAQIMVERRLIDLRNLLDANAILASGFTTYHALGKASVEADM